MPSPPHLPPAYNADDSLPDYGQSLQPGRAPAETALILDSTQSSTSEILSPTQSNSASGNFVFESKRLKLDFGPRKWSPQLPVYGRNGLVEGQVVIKTFKHVDRVELRHTGIVISHMASNGTQALTLRPQRVILSEKSTIWSSDGHEPEPEGIFPFVFVLPDHATGAAFDDDIITHLPPSASVTTHTSSAHVFYFVRVDMFRRGVRFHDSVQTEILYLPRTVSRYDRPYIPLPGSEKPRRICDSEWYTTEVPPKSILASEPTTSSLPALPDINVHLSLPQELHYPSGYNVPFAVTLSGSGLACANIPQFTAGIKLTLVKTATIIVQGIVSKLESVVSTGRVCRVDEDERHWHGSKSSDNSRQVVIRGCLETGTKEKDMSWGVRGYAIVSYRICLSLAPTVGDSHDELASDIWEHSEAVTITSHEWEGQAAVGLPALSLAAASRSSTDRKSVV